MASRCWLGIVAGCMIVVLAGSGCAGKGKKGSGYTQGETVFPEALDGDYPFGSGGRFDETGTLVTDARFENALFSYDSFQVDNSEVPKIEAVASYLRSNTDTRLVAEGHCDERGSREYNMSLGEHRALAVRAYLIGLGIDGARIQTRSYGMERPIDSGHDESAWRLNRRVEFMIYR